MEPEGELLFRDKESMSLRTVKIYAWAILATFLLVLVVQVVIYGLAEWAFFTCFTGILLLCVVGLLGSNSSEIWISDGYLYRKKAPFNFAKPRRIPIVVITGTSTLPAWYKPGGGIVLLTLKNGEEVEFVTLQSYKQSLELETIIRKRLPGEAEIEYGEEYLKNGDIKSAIQEFNNALVANPHSHRAFLLRSWAKQHDKDLPGALEDLNEAIRLARDDGMLYMHRSVLHNQLEMWEEAWTDLERHAQLLPSVTTHPNFLDYKKQLEQKTGRG